MSRLDRRIPKRWTEVEDKILHDEARSQLSAGQIKDWNRIAAKLPGRTNKDCRKRWVNKVCGSLKKGAWNKEEDERLREAVGLHGQRWTTVANLVGSRSSDQCAKRWQHSLDPRLEHEGWTTEEDGLLLNMVQSYGREWKFIQDQDFPTRSRNELKNRYTTLSRRIKLSAENTESLGTSSPSSPDSDDGHEDSSLAFDTEGSLYQVQQFPSNQDVTDWQDQSRSLAGPWSGIDGTDWLNHLASPISTLPASPATQSGARRRDTAGSLVRPKRLCASPRAGSGVLTQTPPEPVDAASWLDTTTFFEGSEPFQVEASGMSQGNEFDEALQNITQPHDPNLKHILPSPVDGTEELVQNGYVGRVSLVVDKCDQNTFSHLLGVSKVLKGKGKLHIEPHVDP